MTGFFWWWPFNRILQPSSFHRFHQEARQQIRKDLQDKTEALSIDTTQRNLNQFSEGISFKPDPLRVPKGSTTPQEWDDFSTYNKNRAYAEMEASIKLREAIQVGVMPNLLRIVVQLESKRK